MKPNFNFILLILFFAFLNYLSREVKAQSGGNIYYVTAPSSKLWFDGTSNISSYICKSQSVNGYAEIQNVPEKDSDSENKDKVVVSVLVRSLGCGNVLMNNDMFNAMNADKFPSIKYELLMAHLSSRPDSSGGWFTLDTKGNLFIAGKKNTVNIKIKAKKIAEGKFRLTGSLPLSMLDYGIVPPSHFFGLIRARDKLVVHFDLIAEQTGSRHNVSHNIQQLLAK